MRMQSFTRKELRDGMTRGLKNKEFKEEYKVLFYNSRFKTFGTGKLQSKWDGAYVVHSVLSNGAVTIMDAKGERFIVNGQQLKVYLKLDVVPLHYVDIFIMENEPEHQAWDIKHGTKPVNNFYFVSFYLSIVFREFLLGHLFELLIKK
jgi:hypothetical protein